VEKLVRFGVSVPEKLLKSYDRILSRKNIPSRSEALRQLIRKEVGKDSWESGQNENENVYGTITITFDHHSHDANDMLTSVQHDFGEIIICNTHIHIDHNNCLEVIVAKGPARRIRGLVDALSRLKCIDSVDPVITAFL